MARRVPERFLVAFSLAGEQRDLVHAVAREVERRLGQSTVFYDEWFEFYIAGREADLKLQRIYHECELAVICISSAYDSKPWTRAEHEVVRARYMEEAGSELDRNRVLAVRVGDGEVEGIHLNYIVPDLRGRSNANAAQLIINRLRLVSPALFEPEQNGVEWPKEIPDFRWPIADHAEAQAAFCALLARASPARVLCIEGASETGKSSLAIQMERNVAELLPGLRCGRFDFKGTADRRIEVDAFAQSLGVDTPDQGGSNQLIGVLGQLLHTPKPTLLIFDTYEDVGGAQTWIERVFFTQLLRAEWLRVVLLGQQTPSAHEAVWESIAAVDVLLELPKPEAWLEYGRRARPDENITLDFVTSAHRLSGGKPATLASLLGPRPRR
jgi:hypothetical protein